MTPKLEPGKLRVATAPRGVEPAAQHPAHSQLPQQHTAAAAHSLLSRLEAVRGACRQPARPAPLATARRAAATTQPQPRQRRGVHSLCVCMQLRTTRRRRHPRVLRPSPPRRPDPSAQAGCRPPTRAQRSHQGGGKGVYTAGRAARRVTLYQNAGGAAVQVPPRPATPTPVRLPFPRQHPPVAARPRLSLPSPSDAMACYMGCRGCCAKLRWMIFLLSILAASE